MINNPFSEINCIAYVLSERRPELIASISPEHFGNKDLGNLFKLIRNFYVDNGSFPSADILTSLAANVCKTTDKQKFITDLIIQIKTRDLTGLTDEILLKELNDYHKLRILLGKTSELVEAIESKQADTALSILQSTYNSVFTEDVCKTEESDLGSISARCEKLNFRTTGIKSIDQYSGLAEGSLFLIGAESGKGKSIASHSIMCHQYDKYEESSCAYYSFEQGVSELAARMWAYYADVNVGNIISGNLAEDEKYKVRLTKAKYLCRPDETVEDFCDKTMSESEASFTELLYNTYPKRKNKIYLFDHAPDFDQLMLEAELLVKTKNVKLFCFDYISIIQQGASQKGLQQWQLYMDMAKRMKAFARKHNCYVISPIQIDTKNDKISIKISSNMLNDADLSIAMSQSDDDIELGCVNVHFMKYRNFTSIPGQSGLKDFKLLCDFSFSKFREFSF